MDLNTIARYFNGNISPEEKEKVMDFFKEKELNPDNEKAMLLWWDNFRQDHEISGPADKVLRNIHAQTGIQKTAKSPGYFRWLEVAASLILFVSITFILFYQKQIDNGQSQSVANIISKQSPLGVKLKFELPDGSMVNLNSQSTLSFPEQFDKDVRKVILHGEAYFDVHKDVDKPFLVECNGSTITVLGTSFNISAYKKEVVVSVTNGKVKVDFDQNDSQSIYLVPGEQVKWHSERRMFEVGQFNLYSITAWKDGIIIFDESDLSEIMEILQRWYGVQIEVVGVQNVKSIKWRYSGEFDNENLKNVLNGISYVKGFDFEIAGKRVTIKL